MNLGNFTLPCTIGSINFYAMENLGANVNVIPKSMFEHLKLAQLKKTDMLVKMADMTKRYPIGIVENVLVKINKFLFPLDFVVMDMLNTSNESMILERSFLATIHAEIDVFNKEISLGIGVKDPRERSLDDYKWMFDLEVDQLADEYELGIGKKGHMLDDIWGKCKKVQGDNTYWWHDQKSKEEERRQFGINIEEIDGWLTIGKRKQGKIQGYDPKGNKQWKEDPQKDVERLESNLKTRCGIVSQLTPPYTPQHNGVSDRRNRTLLDMVRSMMNLTTLPKSFWGYALETAACILNMVLTKMVDSTPYEIWHGKSPKLSYLSFMVQEASRSHGLLEMSGSDKGLELIQKEDTQPSENTSEGHTEIAPTEVESQNVGVPIRRSELGDLNEPPNYKAVLADPESDKWLEAMNTEKQSIKDNQVWYLVDLPSNGGTIGCKWLFKKKTEMDGNVHTFKAHLLISKRLLPKPNELREDAYILGIKIIHDRSKRWIALSQSAYLENTLKTFRMENSKKGYTLMMEKPDYRKSQGAKTPTEQNPGEIHWTAVKTILKYLRNTKDMVLVYRAKPEDELEVSCYADAKAEYIAAAEASMEAICIRKFIDGLGGVIPSNKRLMEMLYDNEPALASIRDPEIL
ncbi:retrovirus-related pol polyprotein from transposon TNT 1-94 [Tanacetum coccineum]